MIQRNLLISFDELVRDSLSSSQPQQQPEDTAVPAYATKLPKTIDPQLNFPAEDTAVPSYVTEIPISLDPQSAFSTEAPTMIHSFSQSIINFEKINPISKVSSNLPNNNISNNKDTEKTIIFVVTFLSVFLLVISLISIITRRRFLLQKSNGDTKSDLLFSSIGMLPIKKITSTPSSSRKNKVRWYDLQQPEQMNSAFDYCDQNRNDNPNGSMDIDPSQNMHNTLSDEDNENVVDLRYPASNISTLSIEDRTSHIASSNSQHDTLEINSLDGDLENNAVDDINNNGDNVSCASDTSYCLGAVSVHRRTKESV